MQIIIKVNKSVNQYILDFNTKSFNKPCLCPNCGKEKGLYHNGVYQRNIIDDDKEFKIPVIRLLCKYCLKSISFLPEFCLPKFQYSLKFILMALNSILNTSINRVQEKLRALFLFYKKRFIRNIPLYILFLRENKIVHDYPDDDKEKAIKVFHELTSLSPEVDLSQRLFKLTNKHFMAK